MARAHVLDTQGEKTRVAFHIPVPAGNNASGITWVAALKAQQEMAGQPLTVLPTGTVPGTITTAELSDLTNGVAYEVVDWTAIPTGMNAAAANAFLDNLHAARQAETQPQRQAQLNYWGFVRT